MVSENDLFRFCRNEKLPCFASFKNVNDEQSEQQVFFYRIFKAKCFSAKYYSNDLEKYLLNKRPSVAFLDNENDTKKKQANINPLGELFIPFHYQGLFEIFSSNYYHLGGILDHETNVISFSSKIISPVYYYVAKELSLYETVKMNSVTQRYKSLTSSINIFEKVNKKWTKFEQGTVLKAIKLDDVDYLMKKNSCHQLICCKFDAKNRFELAIEFKVVDNHHELIAKETILDNNSNKKKSYYLPVDTIDNPDIDVIPIETCINKNLKLNSLQMIRNFLKINLNENLIHLKLFTEDMFSNKIESLKEFKTSIIELNEFNDDCEIICGYNLTENRLFFAPIKSKSANKLVYFTRINDLNTQNIINFKSKLNEYISIADQKIANFNLELNKFETFKTELTNQNERNNSIKKKKIIHFSDLANLGKSMSSDTLKVDTDKQDKLKPVGFARRNKFHSVKYTKSKLLNKTNNLKRSKSVDFL